MSHYASKCVECKEFSKKCIETCMKDEEGKVYYELMYECNNRCDIAKASQKIHRRTGTKIIKEGARADEKNNNYRQRAWKRRQNNR